MPNFSLKLSNPSFLPPSTLPLPINFKSIRLGKPTNRGSRPLKVFLSSKDTALKLISHFNFFNRSQLPNNVLHPISITQDRTKLERKDLRRIYAELDSRKMNGEAYIVIKYYIGHPSIVSTSRLSYTSGQPIHSSLFTQSKN